MTNEEAKNWLNKLYVRADITDEYGDMVDMQPYSEAVDMAIEALEQTMWIPVSERLPEELKGVLVYCPTNDNIFCAYLENGVWKIFSPIALEGIKEIVTAWMPLPPSYDPQERKSV